MVRPDEDTQELKKTITQGPMHYNADLYGENKNDCVHMVMYTCTCMRLG